METDTQTPIQPSVLRLERVCIRWETAHVPQAGMIAMETFGKSLTTARTLLDTIPATHSFTVSKEHFSIRQTHLRWRIAGMMILF